MIFSDPHKKTGVAYGWSTVWTGEVCGGTADDSEGSECHHEFDVGAFVFRQPPEQTELNRTAKFVTDRNETFP